jgi:hypothetical protein
MTDKHLPVSNQRNLEYGYRQAIKLSSEQLAKVGDLERYCLRSGARCQVVDSQKVIILEFLNRSYKVVLPQADITLIDSEEEIPLKEKVLVLHYLTSAKGTPAANRLITFREVPDGANYFPVFFKRAIKPLLDHFGREPERLIDAAEKLGGRKADYGDVAVTINAFSRVSVTLVLWRGDDEFAPDGSILFDASISDYLSSYAITELCETIAWRLIRGNRQR